MDVKNWLQEKINTFKYAEFNQIDDKSEEALLFNHAENIKSSRDFLERYGLSLYSTQTDKLKIIRLYDWYSDNWIGRIGKLVIYSNEKATIEINATIFEKIQSSNVKVYMNNELIFEKILNGNDHLTITSQINKGKNTLFIKNTGTEFPKNGDLRALSIHINSINIGSTSFIN